MNLNLKKRKENSFIHSSIYVYIPLFNPLLIHVLESSHLINGQFAAATNQVLYRVNDL